ncbi:MAG TPA: hypothetical protein DCP63_00015 [Bacteroidetes bacterium]|nr:hypothetical protein [Bacteroidota bacterium]
MQRLLRTRRFVILCFLIHSFIASSTYSRQPSDSLDVLQQSAPKVFIDCGYCDENFLRTEITFVNYVRDPKQADVHVLLTDQQTGGRGTEFTLTFIGQNAYKGMNDTLAFITQQSDTDDIKRRSLARMLKIGLLRYAAKTPMLSRLSVNYDKPAKQAAAVDKWDYWVFRISMNSYLNGQKSQSFTSLYGNLSANRVTNDWKINLSLYANYNESNFTIDDAEISSVSRGQGFNGSIVRSLDDHWSAGGYVSSWSSTYSNIRLQTSAAPAVEYNLFPYSESTRRQLRFLYKAGIRSSQYNEETIYEKLTELLFGESLSATLELRQTWGTMEISIEGSHYFHDLSKRRLVIFGNLSLRIFEGLSLNLYGDYSRIHDQLSLPKAGASAQEVLLQRTQLATNYSYYTSIGLSYTFGAIFNNIVNPRFGGSGGF